ncbi:hypothetical protein M413DRAFT_292402 [Hebeloma cylindrosporum]|uniref:Uncharacterized protein n=1 Tax=Hebeloma cylindrosporum TaxID=76867 RepID=A0A0C2XEM3_HEBCY|nr:hypothetical protein M413DRAFT_292402 [Hebeloma cylindrosporum h7]
MHMRYNGQAALNASSDSAVEAEIPVILPLLNRLPALVLEQSTYHLQGAISKPDFQEFSTHARLVREFSLSGSGASSSDSDGLKSKPVRSCA